MSRKSCVVGEFQTLGMRETFARLIGSIFHGIMTVFASAVINVTNPSAPRPEISPSTTSRVGFGSGRAVRSCEGCKMDWISFPLLLADDRQIGPAVRRAWTRWHFEQATVGERKLASLPLRRQPFPKPRHWRQTG